MFDCVVLCGAGFCADVLLCSVMLFPVWHFISATILVRRHVVISIFSVQPVMLTFSLLLIFTGTYSMTFYFIEFWNGKKKKLGRRYPPSLPCLPLVGSLPFILEFDALPEYFMKMAYKLGPVFTLRFGSRFVAVLNNKASIEDALVRHSSSFSGRNDFYTEKHQFNPNLKGIVFKNYGAEFKRYHKLVLAILKDFGFGSRSQLESRILMEISELIKYFHDTNGKAFNPKDVIILSTSNVPMNIIFGRRRDYKDGDSEAICQIKRFADALDPALDLFPLLRFFPPYSKKIIKLADSTAKLLGAIKEEIDKSLYDKVTDCFVRRYVEKEGPNYDREQLMLTLRDFIAGSSETTAIIMLWFFIYMANNPEIAEHLQKEIDSVVPRDRLPTIGDQPRLPYVEATILELMRHRSALPLAVPHLTLHDTEVLGYFIPADTEVLVNIKAAHMNKTDWPEPEVFRPERFLDEDNKLINKNRVIPFSIGRRSCPGEALAREQLFLFISGLMQNFHIRPPEGMQSITVKTIYGMTESPSPFKIRMIARNA